MAAASHIPPELLVKPLGFVAVTGLDIVNNAIHCAIWDAFNSSKRQEKVLNIKPVSGDYECPRRRQKVIQLSILGLILPTAEYGLFDEISSVHEQKVRCASVHLFSGVYLQCMLDFWLRKCNEFIYFMLFLTLEEGSVPNSMHVSGAIFTSLLSLS